MSPRGSLIALALAVLTTFAPASRAATVWSGFSRSFAKPDGADPFDPQWQDAITPRVALTRVNTGGGLINAVAESGYSKPTSPAGTLWAFAYNNPGKTIVSSNWAALTFQPWADALGANAAGGPPATIGLPSVAYLVEDDLYLDARLTSWTVRTGGGFSYERSSGPAPGDFDADGDVDGDDLGSWKIAMTMPTGASADADGDGDSDGNDFLVWQRELVAGAGAQVAVPEPGTTLLLAVTVVGMMAAGARRAADRSVGLSAA